MEIREGGRSFVVPGEDDPVFFNPAMELNRDITVAVLKMAQRQLLDDVHPTYLDAMAAAGIRGVRAGLIGYDVTWCDRSESAISYIEDNRDRHGLDGDVVRDDVRRLLIADRFDVVDIDPFGSPIPFIDAAVGGTDRLLCVTATDTAPLCGAHLPAGKRRYASVPKTTVDHPEIGLRTLIGAIARIAASHDVAVDPVLSHTTRHYHRTYLAVESGATTADDALSQVGFLERCEACGWRDAVHGLAPPLRNRCPSCDASAARIGPIWLGSYRDRDAVEATIAELEGSMGTVTTAKRLLDRLAGEADIVGHFDHHSLCDRLDLPAGPIDEVLCGIQLAGFDATRTHFGGTTFKTDAPIEAIEPVIVETADSA